MRMAFGFSNGKDIEEYIDRKEEEMRKNENTVQALGS